LSVEGIAALLSPVQQHLLALFFGQPGRVYQSRELIAVVGSGVGAVHRQLGLFEVAGLIRRIPLGNQRYFTSNTARLDHALLVDLVRAGAGLVAPIRSALLPLASRMAGAWIHGAAAVGKDEPGSPVGLVVVSDELGAAQLSGALAEAQSWLARPVEVTVVSRCQWLGLGDEPDLFIAATVNGPRITVIDGSASLK
jgi:hypothetical protein